MIPQIVFQCPHCSVRLNVPISFSGQIAPCPRCTQLIQTPAALMAAVPTPMMTEDSSKGRKWANPAAGLNQSSGLHHTSQASESSRRSDVRGVLPDTAVHHGDLDKKEARATIKMFLIFLLAIALIAAATFFMKAYVPGSKW